MSFDALGQLNWLAVIVGALIYFALGALWYAPQFWDDSGSARSAGIPSAPRRR